MPLPPNIDSKIRQQFSALLVDIENLATFDNDGWHYDVKGVLIFRRIQVSFLSLISLLTSSKNLKELADETRGLGTHGVTTEMVAKLHGTILALKGDYELGMLDSLIEMVEANVASDYLGQAEELLKEGQPGKYDHVPAAVLTGAILENALRILCGRQTPPVSTTLPNGSPKMLNLLIDDLKKANGFNELKAQQLRTWAAIRNAAAHGEFAKFDRKDVEQMLPGVQNFLADFL